MLGRLSSPGKPRSRAEGSTGLVLPFVNSALSIDLMLFLALWPVWWVLGIEQLIPPFFLAWETLRYLLQSKGRFCINAPVRWAFLLALWQLVPLTWIEQDQLHIFLKQTATAWSQVLALFVLWNGLRSVKDWQRIIRGLELLSSYVAFGGVIFVLGLWRAEVLSFVGRMLPAPLIESSAFFSSIGVRTLGTMSVETGPVSQRVSSLALQFTGLSMVALLLIPFITWRLYRVRGWSRFLRGIILIALLLCLIYAQSRIAYVAFVLQLGVFIIWICSRYQPRSRYFLLSLMGLGFTILIAGGYIASSDIARVIRSAFLNWRPGSWIVRFQIYRETIRLLPERPLAGWGLPIRIPGMPSVYSAGSHSGYLGMLFQHGVIGLTLYLGLWASIWRAVLRGLRGAELSPPFHSFWAMAAVSMFAFNIREIADTWWWDQLVTITIWTQWGLIVGAHRLASCGQPNASIDSLVSSPGRCVTHGPDIG